MPAKLRCHRQIASTLLALGLSLPALGADQVPEAYKNIVEHPRPGEILDLRHHDVLAPEELFARIQDKQTLLIGEQHDNPEQHAVETMLLERLVLPSTRVVFEMLGPDVDLTGLRVTTPLTELHKQLQPKPDGWDWSTYGPLYQQVLRQGGTLVSGNLSKAEVKALYDGKDAGTPAAQSNGGDSLDAAARDKLKAAIAREHCGKIPADRLDAMLRIQMARDARMAKQLESATDDESSVLIAGSYHARRDLGVPRYLTGDKGTVIMLVGIDPTDTSVHHDERVSDKVADFVWFTSNVTEPDHCAQGDSVSSSAAPAMQ